MRYLLIVSLVGALVGGCRPEPIPHNPGRGGIGAKHVDHDIDTTQQKAPEGTVVTKADGATLDLGTVWDKHRALVVFYLGGWCPHCKRQLELLQQYQKDISDLDAVIIGISADKPEDAKALHDKLNLNFELYADPDLAVITKWGVADVGQHIAFPATFIVEPGGTISFRKVGTSPTDRPTIEQLIAALKNTQ